MTKKKAEPKTRRAYHIKSLQPSNDTGLYLYRHPHDWTEVGAEEWPDGKFHPVFRCWLCHDVLVDGSQEVSPPFVRTFEEFLPGLADAETAPEPSNIERADRA